METWTKLGTTQGRTFRENLLADPEISDRIASEVLDAAMDSRQYLKALESQYERIFGHSE